MPGSVSRTAAGLAAIVTITVAPAAVAAEQAPADAPSSPAASPAAKAPKGGKSLQLLNINDFHGRITEEIGIGLAATVQQERAKNPNSVLLSAGDNVSASPFVSAVQDDNPTIDYLNALGVKASAVGNHEFDKGMKDLKNRLEKRAKFPYLGANVVDASGRPMLKPYTVVTTKSGVRVGVVGTVTQTVPELTDPSALGGAKFTDPVAATNKYADQLRDGNDSNGEADVVVAEYHEGVHAEAAATDPIASKTDKNVDVIMTGHTHQEYNLEEPVPGINRTRPVVQTGSYGDNLASISLTLDKHNHVTAAHSDMVKRLPVPSAEAVAADPLLAREQKILENAGAYAEKVGSRKLARLEAPVTTGYRAPADGGAGGFDQRDLESSMGHLVADMYKDAANSTGRTPADIGIVNPGGLRDEFPNGIRKNPNTPVGDVTVSDANTVTPFANNLWTTRLTGAQLRQVLEEQWQAHASGKMATRPYLQLGLSSNVTYTYTGDPSAKGFDTRGHNIGQVFVDGKEVKDSDSFSVAIPSFLLGGGDNFATLAKGADSKDTAVVDSEAFQNYLKKLGTVPPRTEKQAVRVQDLKDSYALNGNFTAKVSGLKLDSYGTPDPGQMTLSIDGKDAGTVPVQDDAADIDVPLSGLGLEPSRHAVVLKDAKTGTEVRLTAEFTGGSTGSTGSTGDEGRQG